MSRRFGGLLAVDGCSFQLEKGELVGLIGPNGAGKTTLFNLIAGALKPTSGEIYFNGTLISGASPERIAQLGVARTFQNVRLFRGLTVLDNLKAAHHLRHWYGFLNMFAATPRARRTERYITDNAVAYAELVGVADYLNVPAGELPYGIQKRVEIARALILEPSLLLLDEPAAGLNPRETSALFDLISELHASRDLTILVIDHNVQFVMGIARRIMAMAKGQLITSGPPEQVREDPRVIEAYLGRGKRHKPDSQREQDAAR